MNAETQKVREALSDQLSELDRSLGATVGDSEMLASLQTEIAQLLADGSTAERDIRVLLQERFDRGDLRQETFQLVKSVLDRFVSEQVATSPVGDSDPTGMHAPDPDLSSDDPFASTTVITEHLNEASTADDRVQIGSVLRDRFLLQKRVSGGSMGVVYKALDRRMAEAGAESPLVAIKVLSPQLSRSTAAVRALQREAAKGRCLLHPNIVRFIDLDRDDDLYFIVMEWMEGQTLADILDAPESRTIGVERALTIVRQVAQALDYAHRCGIVHADVKPGNIMVLPDGTAKLFDFGVARVRQTQTNDDDFDPQSLGAMTPAYSSMQVLTGEEPVPADDVFSLGCLMYRLIAGYRVFGPRNAAEAAEEGMKPQRLEALSERQWAALKKAISFARITRYTSMDEFIAALDDNSTLRASQQDRLDVNGDDKPRGKRGWIVALLAVLLVAAGAYQLGLLDRITEPAALPPEAPIDEAPPEAVVETPEVADDSRPADAEAVSTPLVAEPLPQTAPESAPVTDFDLLPPADYNIELADDGGTIPRIAVTLREDDRAVTVDLLRGQSLDGPINLKVEEIGHSGNRSPWGARQYVMSDDDALAIPPGQDRARITLVMSGDPLREADQQSTLRIRIAELPRSELGLLDVVLEDDDQRRFEAGLPANTLAFAVSQVAVSERDPAVQVDILRFNPDDQPIVIRYALQDITATDGEDYFSAGDNSVYLGPGVRSARVLVPLVQDTSLEGDEAFAVDLQGDATDTSVDVYRRLVVIIRDDEVARP